MIRNITELITFPTIFISLIAGIISIFTFIKGIKNKKTKVLIIGLFLILFLTSTSIYVYSKLNSKTESINLIKSKESQNEIEASENKAEPSNDSKIKIDLKNSFINPSVIGECDISFPSYFIFIEEDYLYILDGAGFDIVNISDKENPVLENSFNTDYRTYTGCVWDNHVYLAGYDKGGFDIIAINNNEKPEIIGRYKGFMYRASALSVMGDSA